MNTIPVYRLVAPRPNRHLRHRQADETLNLFYIGAG
jgi:hypothetical protein